ncbi:hypothetical protein OsccyDRAFT_3940 [Leptolyngbyaceae cyanobacterium JSC-12]|nr:hypothetical protein OsccyDRAFT_3940 [Leptolyngbyaceae cyanobacterium JSC-12]
MVQYRNRGMGVKYMLAGGSVVAALGLVADLNGLLPKSMPAKDICQEVIEPKSVLSRDVLAKLLAIPEGSNREQLRQVMRSPYCRLPNIQVRSGATAEREAYPLAFDPQTWLIVLYEGEFYAGYSFSFRR